MSSTPKWLPWTLAVILPAGYLAVKWSRPEAPPITPPPAVASTKATEKTHLVKKVFGAEGKDLRTVTYRMSKEGKPLTCDIFDGTGSRLVKCRFGYGAKPGPSYGKLIEAQMVDAGGGTPLRRIVRVERGDAQSVTVELAARGTTEALLGPSLVGFNPLTDWTNPH